MSIQLTVAERKHSRNPDLIENLLNSSFKNENYDIIFEMKSPNVVRGTFIKKDSKELYESNFGLPVESNGEMIRAETHVDVQPVVIWGFKNGESIPYHPEFEISSDKFVDFLNNELISVHDNRRIDELNNPSPTGATKIDDLHIE